MPIEFRTYEIDGARATYADIRDANEEDVEVIATVAALVIGAEVVIGGGASAEVVIRRLS